MQIAVFIACSLDGYIARPGGGLDFLKPFESEEHGYAEFFDGVDALVIGRGTYDTVLAFPDWPYGDKRLIVCTSKKTAPVHGEELWTGPLRPLVERLRGEGVRRVYADGGALVSSLLREGLIDELTIHVVPIVLGAGRPLFAGGMPEQRLELLHARPYPSGLVQMKYRVLRSSSTTA